MNWAWIPESYVMVIMGGGAILGKSCHDYTSNKPHGEFYTPTYSGYNKLQLAWEAKDTIRRPSDRWWNH